jgi:hypothetical protein
MAGADTRVLGSVRLRVLASLPRPHQEYFFAEVRRMCSNCVARAARQKTDIAAETMELVSEVMAKLLGIASAEPRPAEDLSGDVTHVLAEDKDPKLDARVIWLIAEVGGAVAISHRYEDVRRRRHGGKWREDGYRQVQLEPEHVEGLSVEPDDPHHEADIRQAWLGLLTLAKSAFRPGEDATIVLDVMAHDSDIQAGFGTEWPVGAIVATLNRSHPNPPWNDDRVENAKRRLKSWIARLRRDNGLDSTDLMDLLARYARRRDQSPCHAPAIRQEKEKERVLGERKPEDQRDQSRA